jgi:hypothetical protein
MRRVFGVVSRKTWVFALALAAVPALAIGGEINTFPSWNGTDQIVSFGNPNTSTYGEAVTTPAGDTSVTGFNFWLAESPGFEFQAFISPWDNTNDELTGSLLYLSAVTTATDSNLDEYAFNPSISVTPGTIYVFGITIDNVFAADSGLAGGLGGDLDTDGNSTDYFAFINDGGDFSLAYANWNSAADGGCADNGGACGQAAFLVDFGGNDAAAAPEPGSLMLLGSGMLLLFGIARHTARR